MKVPTAASAGLPRIGAVSWRRSRCHPVAVTSTPERDTPRPVARVIGRGSRFLNLHLAGGTGEASLLRQQQDLRHAQAVSRHVDAPALHGLGDSTQLARSRLAQETVLRRAIHL